MIRITEKEYINISNDVNKWIDRLNISYDNKRMDIEEFVENIDLLNAMNITMKMLSERNGWTNRLDQKGIDRLNMIYRRI